MIRRLLLCLLPLALLALAPAPAEAAGAVTFDDGKLEPSWFGPEVTFRELDDIDYFWVTNGFELAGKSMSFAEWPEPVFLGPKAGERDERDHGLAKRMNNDMADLFREAFVKAYRDRITVAAEGQDGDVRVEGRIVDASTGSTAAKVFVGFGAGSGNLTIDLRFVDPKSGAVLAGLHHRVVSGTALSTSDSKFLGWLEEAAELLADKGFTKLYAKGDKVKD